MANKNGVGIWNHYRTSETPKADGLETSFRHDGMHYRARLYWAPEDFRNPDEGGKCPYVVVWVSPSGKMNSFGNYEDELRISTYVGEVRPRRNWNELCRVAQEMGVERLMELADAALWKHEYLLDQGCTYDHGAYYFPQGVSANEVVEGMQQAWAERNESRKVA